MKQHGRQRQDITSRQWHSMSESEQWRIWRSGDWPGHGWDTWPEDVRREDERWFQVWRKFSMCEPKGERLQRIRERSDSHEREIVAGEQICQ